MITLPHMAVILGAHLGTSPGNLIRYAKALREDPILFTRGKQGPNSAPLETRDAVNLLIAGCVEQKTGTGVPLPELVRRVLALPLADHHSNPEGMWPPLPNAGTALRALIDTGRIGEWGEWSNGGNSRLVVEIEMRGLYVSARVDFRGARNVSATMTFAAPDFDAEAVRRVAVLPAKVFADIVAALGPLEAQKKNPAG
jgi:hypothetical protein